MRMRLDLLLDTGTTADSGRASIGFSAGGTLSLTTGFLSLQSSAHVSLRLEQIADRILVACSVSRKGYIQHLLPSVPHFHLLHIVIIHKLNRSVVLVLLKPATRVSEHSERFWEAEVRKQFVPHRINLSIVELVVIVEIVLWRARRTSQR